MRISVADLMTDPSTEVADGTSLPDAEQLLLETNDHELQIVNDEGRLLGILPDHLILKARMVAHADLLLVDDLMITDIITLSPDDDVRGIQNLFYESHHSRIPVTDDEGVLIGQISRTDIMRMFLILDELDEANGGPEIQNEGKQNEREDSQEWSNDLPCNERRFGTHTQAHPSFSHQFFN